MGDPATDGDETSGMLDGTADHVSATTCKIIRVFLSSTFSDMAEERNLLIQDVYPKIQDYAKRKYGVTFQMVDMRWGVTNEAQNDHMTSACCLKEIANCQKVSVGPNFVVLVGQKYGYRPIPASIEAKEFEAIRKHLENLERDHSVLDVWYLRDDNMIPPHYILQPIDSILKNFDSSDDDLKKASRDEWQDTFEEIRQLLMLGATRACEEGQIGKQTKEKYFYSVTHEEVENGLLSSSQDVNKRCLCFVRSIENLHENLNHHRAIKFIDLLPVENGSPAEMDTDACDRLKSLRDVEIPQKLQKQNLICLSTKWSENGGLNSTDNQEYLQQLAQTFYEKMCWLIDQTLEGRNLNEDQQLKEIRQSLLIRNKWSRIFFGRTEVLKVLEKYIKDKTDRRPMVVYGESGTGKTAVIAKCAKEARSWTSTKPVIIMRFFGTSPLSSHILLTLVSLCKQICDAYRLSKLVVPTEYKEVVLFFNELLVKVSSASRPLIILLDSVDQLSASFEPYTFQWLPKRLPANVKVVMSLVPSVNNLLPRFKSHQKEELPNVEPLPPLRDIHCMAMIESRLAEANRAITPTQCDVVKEIFTKCSLPLFSRVLLEEVITWKSYTSVSSSMMAFSLKEALNNFFRRLEAHHGRVLVRHALGYITAARDGISEMELLDLLSLDDDVLNSIFLFWLPPIRRLPPLLWTRLRLDLDVFLVERDAGDVEVLTWYHRMFKEAAMERYLEDEETKARIYTNLAEYFMGIWHNKPKPFKYSSFLKYRLALTSDDGAEDRNVPSQALVLCHSKTGTMYNKRKLSELPYLLVKCGNKTELFSRCIFNYEWLLTKITASELQLVLEDFELALSKFPDSEAQTLADTLRIAGCTLNDYPDNLALEITGRLLDLANTMPKILDLIHQCDKNGYTTSAIMASWQLYEVPLSALTRSIEGAPADNGDNLLLKKDSRVVSICLNGTVQAWDTQKATLICQTHLPKMKTLSFHDFGLFTSRDERYIVCESRPGSPYMYILEAESLRVVYEHKLSTVHPHHDTVVSRNYVCMDNAVFSVHNGKKVHDLNDYRKVTSYVELQFSICEKFLMIGGENTVEIFTVGGAKRKTQLPVTGNVSVIEVTADGRLAIVGTSRDCVIKLFDITETSPTFGDEVHTYDPASSFPDDVMTADNYASQEVSEICISNKGGAFVSLVKRKYPIVWSLKNVSTKPRLLRISKGDSQFRYLFSVQFSADDKYILAAELAPNVMMWDSVSGDLVGIFRAHENDLLDLVIGKQDNIAVTAEKNGKVVKIWDLQKVLTMEKMATVKPQELAVKNVAFSSQSTTIFFTRVEPPKSSRAYHFIDFYAVEILDLATGRTGVVLPFDRYGHVNSIANSKDASVIAINTGNADANNVAVIDLHAGKLLKTITAPHCTSMRLSGEGKYLCILTESKATIYSVPDFDVLDTYDDVTSGMFTKTNAFVGVTASQMLVRESMDDPETLTIDLVGDIVALHYSDRKDLILVSVHDGIQMTVTAYKSEGFGAIGTLTDVSPGGISDISDDGSICIDTELQIFELERCKRVKRLLIGKTKGDITSVRLSRNGEHAVFLDTLPSPCVKVCRVEDGDIVGRSFLHCVPEFLELVPAMNLIVVISKENMKLFVLALRDEPRSYTYKSRDERLAQILSVKSIRDVTRFELPEKVRNALKEQTKSQQVKHINLNLNNHDVKSKQKSVDQLKNGRRNTSSSCMIV